MPDTTSLMIRPEMAALIGEIDEFKGLWRAIGRLAPERLRQLRRVATIESVGSSTRIEGATLSDRDVEALLARADGRVFGTRDEQEVAGYAEVMETIFASHEHIPITENYIKQLHTTLLQYSDRDTRHRGEYKKLPNSVGAFDEHGRSLGTVIETTSPFDTPREMGELVAWYTAAAADRAMHPLIAVGVFIVEFLLIHPFQDGNGRLSRVLTTLLLLKAGYAYVPYASLESVIEESREAYYLALRRTQTTLRSPEPEWGPWLLYFLRALRGQKERLRVKVERERLLRSSLPELSVTILELIGAHGSMSVADVVDATGAVRATVKKHLADLTDAGRLARVGRGRGTRYVLA